MRWLAALLLTGLGILAWAMIASQAPSITVENRTGLRLLSAEILVHDSHAALVPVDGSEAMRQSLPMRQEGPARLRLRFEGQPERTLQAGWFAPGQAGEAVVVLVTPDSLVFEQR